MGKSTAGLSGVDHKFMISTNAPVEQTLIIWHPPVESTDCNKEETVLEITLSSILVNPVVGMFLFI